MPYPGTLTKNKLGLRVSRAAATMPQTTQAAIFTVSGGRVLITAIVGQVTTVMGATASAVKLVANPTVGADVDLCATAATANDAVGVLYGITGTFSAALQKGAAIPALTQPAVVPVGTIDVSASGSNTGQVQWSCFYLPLDNGARVVAA